MTRTAHRSQPLSPTAERLRDTYSHDQLAHLLYQADLRMAHLHRVMDDLQDELLKMKEEMK